MEARCHAGDADAEAVTFCLMLSAGKYSMQRGDHANFRALSRLQLVTARSRLP